MDSFGACNNNDNKGWKVLASDTVKIQFLGIFHFHFLNFEWLPLLIYVTVLW